MPDDLIPRSQVIEALKAAKEKGNIYCSIDPENPQKTPHSFVILKKALDAIDAIPAAEAVKQKENRARSCWVKKDCDGKDVKDGTDYHHLECKLCGHEEPNYGYTTDFCPDCGSEMD